MCKQTGERKTIFFRLSGYGHFDLSAYERYLAGQLEDAPYPKEAINTALAQLPKLASAN